MLGITCPRMQSRSSQWTGYVKEAHLIVLEHQLERHLISTHLWVCWRYLQGWKLADAICTFSLCTPEHHYLSEGSFYCFLQLPHREDPLIVRLWKPGGLHSCVPYECNRERVLGRLHPSALTESNISTVFTHLSRSCVPWTDFWYDIHLQACGSSVQEQRPVDTISVLSLYFPCQNLPERSFIPLSGTRVLADATWEHLCITWLWWSAGLIFIDSTGL